MRMWKLVDAQEYLQRNRGIIDRLKQDNPQYDFSDENITSFIVSSKLEVQMEYESSPRADATILKLAVGKTTDVPKWLWVKR